MRSERSRPQTLIHCLAANAEAAAHRTAYRELNQGLLVSEELSWAHLLARTQAIAFSLRQEGISKGDRAVVSCRSPVAYVCAVLGCMWAGAIVVPLPPTARGPRLRRMALQVRNLCAPSLGICDEARENDVLRWRSVHDLASAPRLMDLDAQETDVALIQLTSGTTSQPKGVALTHHNLRANQRSIQNAFGHEPGVEVLGWLPLNHDMGLVGNVVQTLYLGGTCTLMRSTHFSSEPLDWLRAISRYCASTSGAPDSAYRLCAGLASQLQAGEIDLSNWRLAFNGAEKVQLRTLLEFSQAYAPFGFEPTALFPCYGLAEASVFVCGEHWSGSPDVEPTCGGSGQGAEVLIVDPSSRTRLEDGHEGEIWVAGPSISLGYWNGRDSMDRGHRTTLSGGGTSGAFLRTGDLGVMDRGQPSTDKLDDVPSLDPSCAP